MKPLRAFNIPLSELNGAVFFRGEEEFQPHYVITKQGEKISRVNVWGVVTRTFESENNFASISIDDFTGAIDVNAFDERVPLLKKAKKGDTVRVIGKVRENNSSIYILLEGLKKLSFEEEALKRLQNIESFTKKSKRKKSKEEKKKGFDEFMQASEIKIEREVIG